LTLNKDAKFKNPASLVKINLKFSASLMQNFRITLEKYFEILNFFEKLEILKIFEKIENVKNI